MGKLYSERERRAKLENDAIQEAQNRDRVDRVLAERDYGANLTTQMMREQREAYEAKLRRLEEKGGSATFASLGKDGNMRLYNVVAPRKDTPAAQSEPNRVRTASGASSWQAALNAQNANSENLIYEQMKEVQGRVVEADDAHRQVLNDGLVAAMRFAADTENNGRLPQSACQLLTRQIGMDGMKSGILDAGYVPSDADIVVNGQKQKVKAGSFGITMASRDDKGNLVTNPVFLSPTDVYAVMTSNPSQFTDEQMAACRESLLQKGYSSRELDALAEMNNTLNISRAHKFKVDKMAENAEFNKRLALSRSFSGTRGGLNYEQTMARDAAKYDSYRFKNVLDAYKSNPQWQSLAMSDPKKAWQIIYDQAGMTQKEGGGTGTPAPTAEDIMNKANAAAEEKQKRAGRTKVDAPVKGAETPANGAQNPAQTPANGAQNPAQTPAPAAAQTEGGEGDIEKGNLSHKGRKWKFYTDKDGKVNGYGTTRSMVAKTEDGRYAVIPTIVNGEELSADEAVKHFKETGEHWGIAKSEDAAKKLANKVHLEEQEGNMKEWNDWLHNNWDKVSPEITNDEGMAKEHQRRESQKYEQKISDMGLSDEFENYVDSEKRRVKKARDMGYDVDEESRENLAKQFIKEQEGSVVKKIGEGFEKYRETMSKNPKFMEEAQKKARSVR